MISEYSKFQGQVEDGDLPIIIEMLTEQGIEVTVESVCKLLSEVSRNASDIVNGEIVEKNI